MDATQQAKFDERAKSIIEKTGHSPVHASIQAHGTGPATLLTEWVTEADARAYVATGAVGPCVVDHDIDLGWFVVETIPVKK